MSLDNAVLWLSNRSKWEPLVFSISLGPAAESKSLVAWEKGIYLSSTLWMITVGADIFLSLSPLAK